MQVRTYFTACNMSRLYRDTNRVNTVGGGAGVQSGPTTSGRTRARVAICVASLTVRDVDHVRRPVLPGDETGVVAAVCGFHCPVHPPFDRGGDILRRQSASRRSAVSDVRDRRARHGRGAGNRLVSGKPVRIDSSVSSRVLLRVPMRGPIGGPISGPFRGRLRIAHPEHRIHAVQGLFHGVQHVQVVWHTNRVNTSGAVRVSIPGPQPGVLLVNDLLSSITRSPACLPTALLPPPPIPGRAARAVRADAARLPPLCPTSRPDRVPVVRAGRGSGRPATRPAVVLPPHVPVRGFRPLSKIPKFSRAWRGS